MTAPAAPPRPGLRIDSIVKRFGGVSAVSDVTIALPQDQLVGLMGTNGSGKSTLFHMVAGFHRPTSGSINFGDHRIDGLRPYKIAKMGVVRTFQHRMLFEGLSVRENIAVSLRLVNSTEDPEAILKFVGLADQADRPADNLAYGHARKLAVGIALGVSPRLLLLDEPAAGLSPDESGELGDLLRRLCTERNLQCWVIDHDMRFFLSLVSHIFVMDAGELIAQGTADEVRKSRVVRERYLGT
jgi:branched-chain amino acid transport system ATP-binding protein